MAKQMPVPPELEFLIEKRDAERDRRKGQRRAGARGRSGGSGTNRRKSSDRRGKPRRKSDR
jgi:hypothetical protein